MTLHFAYGSNMSRPAMAARCPGAVALGTAVLAGWRFIINVDGYATVVSEPGGVVHGVLWRLSPRDLAALNAYEAVDTGLYLRRTLPVTCAGIRRPALVYVARRSALGRPRPGYLAAVLDAARDWRLPQDYVQTLQRWSGLGWGGARAVETGELA